jgi:2-oxoglutarate ferredoxin oxidoreductase subunit delta
VTQPGEARGTVRVSAELCKGCELCIAACPPRVLGLSTTFNPRGFRTALLVADGCTGCGACAQVCPDAAITVFRARRKPRAA